MFCKDAPNDECERKYAIIVLIKREAWIDGLSSRFHKMQIKSCGISEKMKESVCNDKL